MRRQRLAECPLDRAEYPGSVRVDIRPVEDTHVFWHYSAERPQSFLSCQGGVSTYVDCQSNTLRICPRDVRVEAGKVLDGQQVPWLLPKSDADGFCRGNSKIQRCRR